MGWNLPCIIKLPYHILFSNLPYACQEHCMSSYYKPVLSVYVQQPIKLLDSNDGQQWTPHDEYDKLHIDFFLCWCCVLR